MVKPIFSRKKGSLYMIMILPPVHDWAASPFNAQICPKPIYVIELAFREMEPELGFLKNPVQRLSLTDA